MKIPLINKPSGIAVHSSANQKFDFLTSLRSVSQNKELSLVHRLDKSTSGCLLVSKSYKSASYLGKQFLAGNVKKILRVIGSALDREVIEIESKISKDVFEKK